MRVFQFRDDDGWPRVLILDDERQHVAFRQQEPLPETARAVSDQTQQVTTMSVTVIDEPPAEASADEPQSTGPDVSKLEDHTPTYLRSPPLRLSRGRLLVRSGSVRDTKPQWRKP